MTDPFDVLLVRRTLPKVPVPVASSWLAAVLVTAVGSASADALPSVGGGPVPSLFLVAAAVVAVLGVQVSGDRYWPPLHWLGVGLVAALATSAVHLADRGGAPPAAAVPALALVLVTSVVAWWHREGTVSLAAVTTRAREGSYWTTALAAAALGTAVADQLRSGRGTGPRRRSSPPP